MEFYVVETRLLQKDGTPVSSELQKFLRVREDTYKASYDSAITSVKDMEEARKLIQPENVLTVMQSHMSEDEMYLMGNLEHGEQYSFYGEVYTMI